MRLTAVRITLTVTVVALLTGLLPAAPAWTQPAADVRVGHLTVEARREPLGIDATAPRLGWQLTAERRGVLQTAYQVQVATSRAALEAGAPDVWDSGPVASRESVAVAYDGPPLQPKTRYHWRVRVRDERGAWSPWSEPSWWETGVLGGDVGADWITAPDPAESWTDYTVTVDFTLVNDAAGVFFRTNGAGNTYLWQVGNFGGNPTLRPHVRVNGAYTLLKQVSIAHVIDDGFAAPHTMRIEVVGDTFTTFIDGVQVDTTVDATHPTGTVGFRSSGTENAIFHRIDVTAGDETLLSVDFRTGENPFTAGTVVEGGLQMTGSVDAVLAQAEPLLRRDFTVDGEVARARVYATAMGLYELRLNGRRVGDHQLAPGWTDYRTRVQYQTYDVTDLLADGGNAIGVMLGHGWYAGNVGLVGPHVYGEAPAALVRLEITYADGRTQVVSSDATWQTAPGPITSSDLLMGERYDARREQPGWDTAGFDAHGWDPVVVLDGEPTEQLVGQRDQPVRVTQELQPVAVTEPQPGRFVFDLGQNMVGVVRLRVRGEAGTTVTLRHAEVLNPDGTVYTANLRSAQATDRYTLAGDGEEVYQPRFTFHGFRYVEVTGYPGRPTPDAITGVVFHTDAPQTSRLDTSSEMLDQLHRNITWGQRGNFLSVPTDTPARDERLGWTGDINVFAPAAAFNMDVRAFLEKWLVDLRDAQSPNGAFPDVAPRVCCGEGNAGWGDAGVTVPWTLWRRYGDTRVIEDHYEAMQRWIAYLEANSDGLIRPNTAYNDWLNVDDPTPGPLISTAYFARSTELLAEMAAAIGRDADAARYAQLADDIKAAFVAEFVDEDGRVGSGSQTGYVLALAFDLLPDDLRPLAARHLVEAIEARDWHLSTGFLGTPALLPVLADTGHLDVAYRLLLNDTFPSWGYQIARGATTMWERWDSIRPDGSFQDPGMNSFNHYAYGAVGDFLFQTVAGIAPDPEVPGFRASVIRPQPGGGLTAVAGTYESVHGPIRTAWHDQDGLFTLEVEIPANTTATVHVPADTRWAVTESGVPAHDAPGVTLDRVDDGEVVYRIGSGRYRFTVDDAAGALGDAAEATAAASDAVAALVADGTLSKGEATRLQAQLGRVADAVAEARERHDAGDTEAAARAVHLALNALEQARELARRADVDDDLDGDLTVIGTRLSRYSTDHFGLAATLATADGGAAVAGTTVPLALQVTNSGSATLRDLAVRVDGPPGWVFGSPSGIGPLGPGERRTITVPATVPVDAAPGEASLTATVSHRRHGGVAVLPVAATVAVASPVAVEAAAVSPDPLEPGDTATVAVTLRNRADVAVDGSVSLAAPPGWTVADPAAFSLGRGEAQTLTVTATVPHTVTAGPADLEVTVSAAGHAAPPQPLAATVALATPPARYHDHVDAGEPASEQAHNLQASPTSGANVEAGLTRRYSYRGVAGAWFQYDMAVAPGEPFVIRVIETYDGPQRKDYEVLVNGAVVHQRDHVRTASGHGTVTYQVLVGAEHATGDTVTVRFAEDPEGRNYDPSVADVWTLPLDGG